MTYVFEYDITNRAWECQLVNPETNKFEIIADGWVLMGEILKLPLLKVAIPESLLLELVKSMLDKTTKGIAREEPQVL